MDSSSVYPSAMRRRVRPTSTRSSPLPVEILHDQANASASLTPRRALSATLQLSADNRLSVQGLVAFEARIPVSVSFWNASSARCLATSPIRRSSVIAAERGTGSHEVSQGFP